MFDAFHSKYLENLFSDKSFNYRKSLVLTSVFLILAIKVGLVPSEISTFGVKLNGTDQRMLLRIGFWVNSYFFLSFSIFSVLDYWRHVVSVNTSMYKYYFELFNRLQQDKDLQSKKYREIQKNKKSFEDFDFDAEMKLQSALLKEIGNMTNSSGFLGEYAAKLNEAKERQDRINNWVKLNSENNIIIDEMGEVLENTSLVMSQRNRFENNFFQKNADKISYLFWAYYFIVPFGLYLYSAIILN